MASVSQPPTSPTDDQATTGWHERTGRKLGIVAGAGPFPGFVIERCAKLGIPFFVLALKGFTKPETVAAVPHGWSRLGGGRRSLRLLRSAGVKDLVFVGSIRRPSFVQLWPDLVMLGAMVRMGWRAVRGGDDLLIKSMIREVEAQGFQNVAVEALLPELLATPGHYGHHTPDEQAEADISMGIEAAREVGRRDVGQGAVVEGSRLLAGEDAAGTDAMLARVGAMTDRSGPGGVLVKMLKPGQQRKVDLPTIGVGTVEAAAAAGLRGIAIEAGSGIVVDREAVARIADELGLFVVGIEADPA